MPFNQKPVFQRLAASPPRYPVVRGVLDHDSYLLKGGKTGRQTPPVSYLIFGHVEYGVVAVHTSGGQGGRARERVEGGAQGQGCRVIE